MSGTEWRNSLHYRPFDFRFMDNYTLLEIQTEYEVFDQISKVAILVLFASRTEMSREAVVIESQRLIARMTKVATILSHFVRRSPIYYPLFGAHRKTSGDEHCLKSLTAGRRVALRNGVILRLSRLLCRFHRNARHGLTV